jgi:hypothetical protein
MSCGCSTPSAGAVYAACAGVPIPLAYASDATLQNIAAGAGARSGDWTMCVAMAFLKTRRFLYWKLSPGDCGTNVFDVSGTDANIASGVASAANSALIASPLSGGVTAPVSAVLGIASKIFGIFTQAHVQAVQTEETTLCQVAIQYNKTIAQIEAAVAAGNLLPSDASTVFDSIVQQLIPVMQSIAKKCCGLGSCDAACGYIFCLRALQVYNDQYVFPGLAPKTALGGLFNAQGLVPASAGAPGSGAGGSVSAPIQNGIIPPALLTSAQPTMLPTSISLPSGVGGLILVGGGLLVARAL